MRRWAWPVGVCSVLLAATMVFSLLDHGDAPGQTALTPSSSTSAPSPPPPAPTSPAVTATSTSGPPAPSSASSTTASSSSTTPTQAKELHGRKVDPQQVAASQRAVRVARRFTDLVEKHHGTDEVQWWPDVKPLLSDMGVSQLQGRSAAEVGFTRRTGKVRPLVTDVSLGDQFTPISVPTDQGAYLVLVEENGQDWKIASVSRLTEQ